MNQKELKYKTLGHLPSVTVKQMASLFMTAFGIVWLFLEPMGLFGLYPQFLAKLGWYGYLILAVTALAVTVLGLNLLRRHKFVKIEFINLEVESSIDGCSHYVRAPENIQVWDFVNLFLEHLKRGAVREQIDAMARVYDPVLHVRTGDTDHEITNSLTLKEANLKNGDVCFIKGQPRKHEVRYSLGPIQHPTRE